MQTKPRPIEKTIHVLRGGQITIPIEIRKRLGIDEHSLLKVTLDEQGLRIAPVKVEEESKGSPWIKELYEYFAPVRAEILEMGVSEEELYADIDAAVKAVRAENRERQNQ